MTSRSGWVLGGLLGGLIALPLAVEAGRVDADLAQQLRTASSGDAIPVIVFLSDQADPAAAAATATGAPERAIAVVNALQSTAASSQRALDGWLTARAAAHQVRDVQAYWIFNGYAMRATPDAIAALAALPGVDLVASDAEVFIPPVSPGVDAGVQAVTEWGVAKINAPLIWENLGAFSTRGEGSVVGVIDTGLDATHPDLASAFTGDWFDAVNGIPFPYDDNTGVNHGTHVSGTSVGGNASGSYIGVAPGARLQSCKAFKQSGSGSTSDILQCMQWFLDPDGNPLTADQPDVVNNSWSASAGFCNPIFQGAVNAWWAAGIFPNFAAGNSGPGAGTSASPANYGNAYAVGATNINDVIAGFSSRGPSACTGGLYPEVSAPGVNIKSAAVGVAPPYRVLSGTSMATPHVTGCIALMRSAADLDGALGLPEIIWDWYLLNANAVDLGVPGHDNVYGAGRIDCAKATLVGILLDLVLP